MHWRLFWFTCTYNFSFVKQLEHHSKTRVVYSLMTHYPLRRSLHSLMLHHPLWPHVLSLMPHHPLRLHASCLITTHRSVRRLVLSLVSHHPLQRHAPYLLMHHPVRQRILSLLSQLLYLDFHQEKERSPKQLHLKITNPNITVVFFVASNLRMCHAIWRLYTMMKQELEIFYLSITRHRREKGLCEINGAF